MDQQWTAYSDSAAASRQARYAPQHMESPQHQRDPNMPQMKQDPYASPTGPSRASSMAALPSPGGAQSRGPQYNDVDGDVPMEDADPYKPKFNASRASVNHQHRQSQQFLQQVQQQEESAAARRYSPMNLSPTSPYSGPPQQGGQNYASFSPQTQTQPPSSRQSPTRTNPYMSPANNYYSPPGTSSDAESPSGAASLITCHSYPASGAPATTVAVQHEPRELLPAVGDGPAQCRVQQRSTIAACRKPQPSSATANRPWACTQVREVREHGGSAAKDQSAAALSPRASRRWLHQCWCICLVIVGEY
jgi:dual specificity protein kinase YAK1